MSKSKEKSPSNEVTLSTIQEYLIMKDLMDMEMRTLYNDPEHAKFIHAVLGTMIDSMDNDTDYPTKEV